MPARSSPRGSAAWLERRRSCGTAPRQARTGTSTFNFANGTTSGRFSSSGESLGGERHDADADMTAVWIRGEGDPTARLLCGAPMSTAAKPGGEIAFLPSGQVVAYLMQWRRTSALYVFRTGVRRGATVVPGVGPPVHLMMSSHKRTIARRARNFLERLTSYGH